MRDHNYYVYILAKGKNSTFYTGVTNDIAKRVSEHKLNIYKGFTEKYDVKILVYYEWFTDINYAIEREKIIKKYKRQWKMKLIERMNPEWKDLFNTLLL